jgi:hypothetical protein
MAKRGVKVMFLLMSGLKFILKLYFYMKFTKTKTVCKILDHLDQNIKIFTKTTHYLDFIAGLTWSN